MIKGNKFYINNTYRSTAHACGRKYLLARICRLATRNGSAALRYGSTWHGFQEGYYRYVQENGWDRRDIALEHAFTEGKEVWDKESESQLFNPDYRSFENACQSYGLYLERYPTDHKDLKILHTEKNFEVSMGIVNVLEKDYEVIAYGKIDLAVELMGRPWLFDHKTTGQTINYMADKLKRSPQMMGYTWAGKSFNFNPEGMMVNYHQLTSRWSKITEKWGKITCDFRRVPHIFSDYNLDEWEKTTLHTAKQMIEAIVTNDFPQQFDSCYQFGQCQYARICEQNISSEKLLGGYIPNDFVVKPRKESYE